MFDILEVEENVIAGLSKLLEDRPSIFDELIKSRYVEYAMNL